MLKGRAGRRGRRAKGCTVQADPGKAGEMNLLVGRIGVPKARGMGGWRLVDEQGILSMYSSHSHRRSVLGVGWRAAKRTHLMLETRP